MATAAQLLGRKPRAIYSVGPDAPVLEAVRLMAEYGVGALLVMTGEKLVGVISERDYARKVILMGRSSSDTPVHQIMTKDVFTVEPLPAGHALWCHPRVLVSPHVAAVTARFWERETGLIVENIRRYLAGSPLANTVDPEAGY